MIIPNIWENKKCSKPPTRLWMRFISFFRIEMGKDMGTGIHFHDTLSEVLRLMWDDGKMRGNLRCIRRKHIWNKTRWIMITWSSGWWFLATPCEKWWTNRQLGWWHQPNISGNIQNSWQPVTTNQSWLIMVDHHLCSATIVISQGFWLAIAVNLDEQRRSNQYFMGGSTIPIAVWEFQRLRMP